MSVFDSVQRGWLDGDDYRWAARRRDADRRATGGATVGACAGAAPGGPPAAPPPPAPPSTPCGGAAGRSPCSRYETFTRRVLDLHRVAPSVPGQMPRCGCGSAAVLCPYLRLARDVLGHPLPPGRPGDLPYVEA